MDSIGATALIPLLAKGYRVWTEEEMALFKIDAEGRSAIESLKDVYFNVQELESPNLYAVTCLSKDLSPKLFKNGETRVLSKEDWRLLQINKTGVSALLGFENSVFIFTEGPHDIRVTRIQRNLGSLFLCQTQIVPSSQIECLQIENGYSKVPGFEKFYFDVREAEGGIAITKFDKKADPAQFRIGDYQLVYPHDESTLNFFRGPLAKKMYPDSVFTIEPGKGRQEGYMVVRRVKAA